jgi:hypothetical protein
MANISVPGRVRRAAGRALPYKAFGLLLLCQDVFRHQIRFLHFDDWCINRAQLSDPRAQRLMPSDRSRLWSDRAVQLRRAAPAHTLLSHHSGSKALAQGLME